MRQRNEVRFVLIGAVLGAFSGAALALTYSRRRSLGTNVYKPIQAGQVVRLGVALVAVARQFLELLSR